MTVEVALAGLVVVVATGLGVTAGIGGAVLIVPLLLLLDFDPAAAAAVGLLATTVASTAAAPRQLRQRLANHRLAVVLEIGALTGAIAGAVASTRVSAEQFRYVLAAAVACAAAAALARRGVRNRPASGLVPGDVGEHAGRLSGAYRLGADVVPYRVRRVPGGVALAGIVGAVAGLTGTAGGYLKVPLMSEVMHVPSKVAAATSTFASGVTATGALIVYVGRDALEHRVAAVAILAALAGGTVGARLQQHLGPAPVRRTLGILLVVTLGVLVWPR